MKCCICGKDIQGYGNNPYGALDVCGRTIQWKPEDECCDNCNTQYVILGRLITLHNSEKYGNR